MRCFGIAAPNLISKDSNCNQMELLYILTAPIFMLQAVCKYWMSRSYDVYILMQHRHDLQVFYHGLLIILCIFTSPMVDACDLKWCGRNPPHRARQPRSPKILAVERDAARGSGGDAPVLEHADKAKNGVLARGNLIIRAFLF